MQLLSRLGRRRRRIREEGERRRLAADIGHAFALRSESVLLEGRRVTLRAAINVLRLDRKLNLGRPVAVAVLWILLRLLGLPPALDRGHIGILDLAGSPGFGLDGRGLGDRVLRFAALGNIVSHGIRER